MPNFLITLLAIATCTTLALRPVAHTRALALVSFWLGQLVNELPQLAAVLLIGATALAVVEGHLDPSSAVGVALLLAAGLVLLGLVEIGRRATAAPRVLTEALTSSLDPPVPTADRPRLHLVRGLIGFLPLRPTSVGRVAHLHYGPHRRHRLDVYHRRDLPSGAPVLVYWHGGGYSSGAKHREARALLHRFAARGWVCVDADYRLRPEAGFTDHLADARDAVTWVRAHADRWGGDARTLVLAGSSAGAHLATLLALGHATVRAAHEDGGRTHGAEALDAGPVSAVVGLYGYYGRYYGRGSQHLPPSSPLDLDARHAPAMLLVDAELDSYVGTGGGQALAAHLRAASGHAVAHAVLPGAQHAFDVYRSVRFEAVVDAAVAFAGAVRGTTHRAPAEGSTGRRTP